MFDITIYSTPTCPYCNMAKDFLKENNIPFKDLNVGQDHAAAQAMIAKSGQMGVPVIVVKKIDEDENPEDAPEDVMVGFDKDHLSEVLGIKEK